MTYRSLLVHLDNGPHAAARSQAAITLARAMDCHLVGLAPTGVLAIPAADDLAGVLGQYNALAWDALQAQARQAALDFRAACAAAGTRSFEALVDSADSARSVVRHAHCSDLVLLSQPDPADPAFRRGRDCVEQVLLHSARPTLLLPHGADAAHLARCLAGPGRRVLVAWDDSREAARAVADALPLLRLADTVQVLNWREARDDDDPMAPRLAALQQWLAWQGVTADAAEEVSDIAVAEALQSRAADQASDLIVMGAYGHARWTERVLGGATRGLLDAMAVPVLMSH